MQLEEEKRKSEELKNKIKENENKKQKYLEEFSNNGQSSSYREWLVNELEKAKLMACLTDVKGNGVFVKLNDAARKEVESPALLILHDSDIVGIINELKKSGAQAISVNGERIIAMSELVCAGPTIKINNSRYPVPYDIKAIGDPQILMQGLKESNIVKALKEDGISVEITEAEDILVEKYNYKIDDLITSLEVAENEN